MKTLLLLIVAVKLAACTQTRTTIYTQSATLRDVGALTIRTNATLMPTP